MKPSLLEPAPQGLVSAEVVKQSHHSLRLTKSANQPCAISDWRVPTLSGPCARPQQLLPTLGVLRNTVEAPRTRQTQLWILTSESTFGPEQWFSDQVGTWLG